MVLLQIQRQTINNRQKIAEKNENRTRCQTLSQVFHKGCLHEGGGKLGNRQNVDKADGRFLHILNVHNTV